MIPALAQVLLAALTLSPADFPGLWAGTPDRFSGNTPVNFRQADLDGDGAMDVLLAGKAYFQRSGGFSGETSAAFPDFGERCAVDLWRGRLYCWGPATVRMSVWENGGWTTPLTQELPSPEGLAISDTVGHSAELWGEFARFLFDLDKDNQPELVVAAPDALHLYRMGGDGRYAALPPWELMPPMRLALPERGGMDSEFSLAARDFVLPVRRMSCRILLEDTGVHVVTHTAAPPAPDGKTRIVHTETTYGIGPDNRAAMVRAWSSSPVDASMQPCRLNADSTLDFAGECWTISGAASIPTPLHETLVSLDGGATFLSRKTYSYRAVRPHCLFLDWDGDGDCDWYSEYPDWHASGAHEMATRFLTRAGVRHSIFVYPQENGAFSNTPLYKASFDIAFDDPPVKAGADFLQYCAGNWLNASGDFNGDGTRDPVVFLSKHRLGIFRTRNGQPGKTPDATLDIPEDTAISVYDVNGDGRSDLILMGTGPAAASAPAMTRVYFAREAAP